MIFKKSLMVVSALGALALTVAAGGCSSGGNTMGDGGTGDDGSMTGDGKAPTDAKADVPKPDMGQPLMCPTPDSAEAMKYMAMYIPPNMPKMDCNSTQVQGYWDNCRDSMSATTMKCQAWGQANMNCAKCLESARTDASWGPLVLGGGVISLNISGCVDLKGDKTCAQNYQAMDGCTRAACDNVCPVMDNQSFMDWQKCVQTATTGVCKSYNDKVTMTCLNDASAAYNQCRSFQDFKSGYFMYVPIFCGGGGG